MYIREVTKKILIFRTNLFLEGAPFAGGIKVREQWLIFPDLSQEAKYEIKSQTSIPFTSTWQL